MINSTNLISEANRLCQSERLRWLQRPLDLMEFVPVCLTERAEAHTYGLLCALVPLSQRDTVLDSLTWELGFGDGKPTSSVSLKRRKRQVDYHRYGKHKGSEPLVIERHFYGIRPNYFEISEEFRLFHDLYFDRKTDQYLRIDDAGNETKIISVKENQVEIRLKEILQFGAIKEMMLSIQLDYREMSPFSLEQLKLDGKEKEMREELLHFQLGFGELATGSTRSFSRLQGKRLVMPLLKEKSGFWGFSQEEPQKYLAFIIGTDNSGDDIEYTSNPNHLSDYFGGNAGAPHFLTPVHFRKQVLDKYYQQPSKYKVEDGYLRCGSLWGIDLDNQEPDRVCAWLGDLGERLPYTEQLHWKSHNVAPSGNVSEPFFRRQILAQFTDSKRLEDLFEASYRKLYRVSNENLGWSILKPLHEKDEYHLSGLRIPASDEQCDFDALTLSLTKIMIDSINEKMLRTLLSGQQNQDLKAGILILERVFQFSGACGYQRHIEFLRKLQELRSSGSAHRKGSKYKVIAAKHGLEEQSLALVFTGMIKSAIEAMDYLADFTEKVRPENPQIKA